jgi:hypothetical protein
MASSQQDKSVADAAQAISNELGGLTARANQGSHKLCQYVLENVLLHQAAAQQLQVRVRATYCFHCCCCLLHLHLITSAACFFLHGLKGYQPKGAN